MHALIAAGAVAAGLAPAAAAAPAGSTTLVDQPTSGALPQDGLRYSILQSRQAMSADGTRVVFESEGDALHPGEGKRSERYVYVHDRTAGTTTNVCRASSGEIGNDGCNEISISPNGRYVVFRSSSTNLGGGNYSMGLIFRRDLQTGTTELMSRATGASGAAAASGYVTGGTGVADNGTVVFATTASLSPTDIGNNRPDVYARIGTETRLMSRTGAAVIGNGASEAPTISGDGGVVAFESDATNFGTDTNGKRDVFTTLISGGFTPVVGSRRTTVNDSGNGESRGPSLSQTGRYLGFYTKATNLFSTPITTDANGLEDVILRDTAANTNTVVSIGAGNAQGDGAAYGAAVSADGTKVAFAGDIPSFGTADDLAGTFVRNLSNGTTSHVSRDNAGEVISGGSAGGVTNDGGVVAFGGQSDDFGSSESQVFVRLTATNETKPVSVPTGGVPAGPIASDGRTARGSVSADGGLVVFTSRATGLAGKPFDGRAHAFLRDVRAGTTRMLDLTPTGSPASGELDGLVISADGTTAAFVSEADDLHPDAAGAPAHLFVIDLASGAISVADRNTAGQVAGGLGEPELSLSDDGTRVAFTTKAPLDSSVDTNAEFDAYVRDLRTGTVQLASRRDGADGAATTAGVWSPVLSGDGKRVGFNSSDPNLVGGDANAKTDAFVRDLAAGSTMLVSRIDGPAGAPGNGASSIDDLSADGSKVSFSTGSTNLDNGDTTPNQDVHLRDLTTGQTRWISRPDGGGQPDNSSADSEISADGTRVGFSTRATNLVGPDANGTAADALLRDLSTGALTRIGITDGGGQPANDTSVAALSANGRCAVLQSNAPEMTTNGYASPDYRHVYLRAIDADCPGPLPVKQDDPPKQEPEKPALDRLAPSISKLGLSRKSFATKGKKKGSTLTFTLSEAASVKLTVATTKPGKKKGKACVKPSKAKKKAKKCTIVGKPKDLQVVKGIAGKNTVKVTGWAKGKRLPKGTYRLLLVATDGAGNRMAAPAAIDFRIR